MHGLIDGDMYIKKESEKDKLRMSGGAWTINLDEVNNKEIKNIVYFTERNIYRISYSKAFDKGFIKQLAGELKLIVPLKHWRVEEK
tara:strand:+ start:22242 stop:22499 length:258 start_codon:yes stop_codon:yes gene_type:complete